MENHKKLNSAYQIFIVILAILSIILVILDLCGKISLASGALFWIDTSILIIFAVDYIVRFIISKSKWQFFKQNIFDLLAIIPFNSIFSFFRFARVFRIAKLSKLAKLSKFTKLARLTALFGRFGARAKKFLHTNGFIYVLYISGVLILISSFIMMYAEGKGFFDALWWSIVTVTTVGYGDISPETGVGRVMAVVLMIFGIGFISMLTGTITTFFANRATEDKTDKDVGELEKIITDMDDNERGKLLEIARILKK
ncbi:MAG: ion transporter [Ruminococcus sp.]|nr:ion transporter [Ruminococcus sp.]MCM1380387.1 ion transporter [Muribaculaceae bacterium]MCM1478303.1 ion transporter [Muribaculaceae bacterium]